MKFSTILSSILLPTLAPVVASHAKDATHKLVGPYLGQEPPSLTAKVFAPGVVSTEHRDLSAFFSLDMKELYFTRRDNTTKKWLVISYKSEDDGWQQVDSIPRIGRPIFSPDGKVMHLGKHYKEKTPVGWSEVKSLGQYFKEIRIMRLTSSLNGTFVMDEATREGNGTLRYSLLNDGEREPPIPFGKEINTGRWNAHPFIAPDESYIIWDGERDGGLGANDLYISFKQKDGAWGKAINFGSAVNSEGEESGGYVTPDGKYLFFNSNRRQENSDIYWVDAQIIESLRLKQFGS